MLVSVKNLAKSPQIVHTEKGARRLVPGDSGEAEFSDGEFASMKRNPTLELTVDGEIVSGAAEIARPLEQRAAVVWGEGKNEAGQPKKLSKKAQKELDAKREEAISLGLEIAADADMDAIQKAIDTKLAE